MGLYLLVAACLFPAAQSNPVQKTVEVKVVDDRGLPITRALVRPDTRWIEDLSSGVEEPEVVHRGWPIEDVPMSAAVDSPSGLYPCRLWEHSLGPVAYVERDGVPHAGWPQTPGRMRSTTNESPDEFTITIPRPMGVQGTVYGQDGKPAAHAVVVIGHGTSLRSQLALQHAFFFDDGLFPAAWTEKLTADEHGRFAFRGIRPDEVSLSAFTPDSVVPHTRHLVGRPGANVEVALNLMPACWIEATVEPRSQESLLVPWRSVRAGRDGEAFPELDQLIGEEESLRLGPLGPGVYEVVAHSADGRSSHTMNVTLMPGQTKVVDFPAALAAGPRLHGEVPLALRKAFPLAQVHYKASPRVVGTVPISEDGTFEVPALGPGPMVVSLVAPASESQGRLVVAEELMHLESEGAADFAFVRSDGSIRVPAPILESGWQAQARLLLSERPRLLSSHAAQRTRDGVFVWEGLAPGRYVVELFRNGWPEPERSLGTFPVIVP